MRFLLGCVGLAFVIFGGCVLAVFSSEGVASDEVVFVIAAAAIFLFGGWALYKAVTMRPAPRADDNPDSGPGPSV